MKQILLCLLFAFHLHAADTRWTRVLTYTDNYENGSVTSKIITTISESGDKGRIDSRNNPAKHPDNKTAEKAGALIFPEVRQIHEIEILNPNKANVK